MVLKAGYDDVTRTTIYTGRPMSVYKSPYIVEWYVKWCDPISSAVQQETGKQSDAKSWNN
jgi:hypothetical protein